MDSNIFELSDENYVDVVQEHNGTIFIDFYSPMCGPCQELLSILPRLKNSVDNDVLVAKVDVNQNPKLAKKYEISSVPFCVSIGKDKMVKDYELGSSNVERYISMIKKAQGKNFFQRLFS